MPAAAEASMAGRMSPKRVLPPNTLWSPSRNGVNITRISFFDSEKIMRKSCAWPSGHDLISRISATRQSGNALATAWRTASSAPGSGRSATFTGKIRQIPDMIPARSERMISTAAKAPAHMSSRSLGVVSMFALAAGG